MLRGSRSSRGTADLLWRWAIILFAVCVVVDLFITGVATTAKTTPEAWLSIFSHSGRARTNKRKRKHKGRKIDNQRFWRGFWHFSNTLIGRSSMICASLHPSHWDASIGATFRSNGPTGAELWLKKYQKTMKNDLFMFQTSSTHRLSEKILFSG